MSKESDVESQPPPTPPPPHGAPRLPAMRVGRFVGVGVCAVVFGLLIWAKLQLVAGIPRTAIADPETSTPATGRETAPPIADR